MEERGALSRTAAVKPKKQGNSPKSLQTFPTFQRTLSLFSTIFQGVYREVYAFYRITYFLVCNKNIFLTFATLYIPFLVARYLLSRLKATWPTPILGLAFSGSGLT